MSGELSGHELKLWIKQKAPRLCAETMNRVPNMLIDEDALLYFLETLAETADKLTELQLSSIQNWALTEIGQDARGAYDWLVVLRVMKDEIGELLENSFSPKNALIAWRRIDIPMTYAVIEASQLASDIQRSEMLEHMIELRRQREHFEESKNKFIAVAAHELKTPMTIVEGYANIMRAETAEDPKMSVYVKGLHNGVQRMNEIVGDMLDVSLLDLQSIELNFRSINLEKTVLLTADKLDRFFSERNVHLKILPFEVDSSTYGDEEKIQKALNKVILNGLKFTPDGGMVTISAASELKHSDETDGLAGFIDIQIQDMGVGIDPANFETIFQRFGSLADASLHSSSKTKFKGGGPGLGLPIAKGIIEAHGGKIWVESPGHDDAACPGSTFHIELPIWLIEPNWT